MGRYPLPLATVVLAAITVAGCRPEGAQPRSLMMVDDEQRKPTPVSDKPTPLPEEPRPVEFGGSGTAVAMQLDGTPATAPPVSEKPTPVPAEPSLK